METNFLFRIIEFLVLHLPVFPVSALGMPDIVVEWAKETLTTSMETLVGTGDAMCGIFAGTGEGTALAGVVDGLESGIVDACAAGAASIGMAICAACWIFALVDLAIQDRMTPETFIKSTARLGVGMFACDFSKDLYDGIKDFGGSFASWISSATDGGTTTAVSLTFDHLEENKDHWFTIGANVIFFNTVILITAGALLVIAYIVQISLVIERAIRGAFLGIALGMLADDGWKGPGARYIKKFIAVCCQGGVLILIGRIVTVLQAGLMATSFDFDGLNTTEMFKGALICIGVGFAGSSLMFKSLGYVNDIFGA